MAQIISSRLSEPARRPTLSLSKVGDCIRKLWYDQHCPEKAEPLLPKTRLKFLYGDIIEHLVLFLAELAGYKVTDKQKKVELYGVPGSIDCRIDGHLADIKSAASRSMAKFEEPDGLTFDDPFGYLSQLRSYGNAEGDKTGSFIAVDKQHGDIVVSEYELTDNKLEEKIEFVKHVVSQDTPPNRPFTDEPDGKSGNRKLGVKCSYCAYKGECWPGLKIAFYSNGPKFLTRIERQPEVPVKSYDNQSTD